LLARAYGPLAFAAFAAFAACGILSRRSRDSHKRLMTLATIAVMDAPSHLVDLPFWVALAAHDLKKHGRLHAVTLYGGLTFFLLKPLLTFVIGPLA